MYVISSFIKYLEYFNRDIIHIYVGYNYDILFHNWEYF